MRHRELEILPNQPFANCKLDREEYANILTKLIESYPEGFVLAINDKWGNGKTTFVKMWNQSLLDLQYRTIYFNAWENDFDDSPLTALIGELKTLEGKANKKQFESVVSHAAKISKHVAPTMIRAIAAKYIDTETLVDALSDITKGVTDIFEKDVEEYSKRKKSISHFRRELGEFVAQTSSGKPVVFFIDELDRCRPNYAVSIL